MPGSIQSIERGAAVLRLLAAGPRHLTLNEVAGSLGLAKGTVHGILRTLVDVGFAAQDPSSTRYRIGAELTSLASLSAHHLDAHTLRSHVTNWADTLAARSNESVRVGMLVDGRVEVVHHVFRPDGSPQTLATGQTLPAHTTALGKAMLAYHPSAVERVLAHGLTPSTRCSTTAADDLHRLLRTVRATGVALEVQEECVDVAGVAAPIRGRGGLVVAAVGLSGPMVRFCDGSGSPHARLVSQVVEVAATLSRKLQA